MEWPISISFYLDSLINLHTWPCFSISCEACKSDCSTNKEINFSEKKRFNFSVLISLVSDILKSTVFWKVFHSRYLHYLPAQNLECFHVQTQLHNPLNRQKVSSCVIQNPQSLPSLSHSYYDQVVIKFIFSRFFLIIQILYKKQNEIKHNLQILYVSNILYITGNRKSLVLLELSVPHANYKITYIAFFKESEHLQRLYVINIS